MSTTMRNTSPSSDAPRTDGRAAARRQFGATAPLQPGGALGTALAAAAVAGTPSALSCLSCGYAAALTAGAGLRCGGARAKVGGRLRRVAVGGAISTAVTSDM